MVRILPAAGNAIDAMVEAFESARQLDATTRLTDFLPPVNHPEYRDVAVELVRVDMEYSWESGAGASVEFYQSLLPEVLADPTTLAAIAFEEYRLRALAGQRVDSDAYARKFAISVDAWPQVGAGPSPGGNTAVVPNGRGPLELAWHDALQLADNVTDFPGPGDAVAGFELVEELGRGAFARVFLARQRELADRPVALKIACGTSLEPQHLARLQHTNVVPIYSVHQVDSFTAVCMPFFGSRTLADVNRELASQPQLPASGVALLNTVHVSGDLTWPGREPAAEGPSTPAGDARDAAERLRGRTYVEAVLDLTRQAAEGLAHAHARGIVHRDLKPANILIDDDARPLLLDFNLSESIVVNGRPALTAGGTLPYMSPEQLQAVRSGGRVDKRSDVFSLGVILYELLAGRRPFPDPQGAFEQMVAQAIADRQRGPGDLRKRNRAVSPALASIVARCLTPDVSRRYPSADALVEDLRRQLEHRPLQHAANPSLVERCAKWGRRHPRASSGGMIAALAAVALTAATIVVAHWSAERRFLQFQHALPPARSALTVAEADLQLIQHGIDAGKSTLAPYGVDDDDWQRQWAVRALKSADAKQLRSDVAELTYLVAEATARSAVAQADDDLAAAAARWNHLAAANFDGDVPAAIVAQRETIARLGQDEGDVRERDASRAQFVPGDPKSLSLLDLRLAASRLLSDRKFRVAMPYLAALRDRTPQDSAAWLMLGNAYAALGQSAHAELSYDAAAALLPGPAAYVAILNRGLSRLSQRQYEHAIDDFTEVTRRRPQLACGYLNRGLAYAATHQHQKAIDDYSTALELGAKQTRIYFLRARSWQALKNVPQAKHDYATGLKLLPSDATSWVARGMARLGTDPEEALADFRAALELAPGDLEALHNVMVVAADRLDRVEDARDAASEILQIQPDNAAALAGRAVLAARQGDRDAALQDIARLWQVSQEPVYSFQAACALSLTADDHPEDAERAAAYLLRAVVAQPLLAARARTDPDLANLRQDDRFSLVLETAASASLAAPQSPRSGARQP